MPLQRLALSGLGDTAIARALKRIENLFGRTPVFGAHRTVTAASNILDSDDLLLCDTTSAGFTVLLPPAPENRGRRFTIKKLIAANTLTLDGNGSETIDGATTKAWTTQYTAYTVQSDGTQWWIV